MSHSWKLMWPPLNGPAVLNPASRMQLLDWKGCCVLVQLCVSHVEELPGPQEQHFEAMLESIVVLLQFAFSGADVGLIVVAGLLVVHVFLLRMCAVVEIECWSSGLIMDNALMINMSW
ncbi:hypothetical protein Nepgr_016428 [Nepenthes gracilis]|uniref:Uncharacterized protein n=1 Tax=Nepenthes gracilis TaxID=150966 RepID=A0AAD3SP60_NEPGR|nr:hypothetical protein Nepgr_016428 [Nepenthes gracilis]